MNTLIRRISIGAMLSVISLALVACGDQPTATTVAPTATTAASTGSTDTTPATATTSSDTTAQTAATKLNLNTVTEAELTSTIPNFPSRMVREFQEYKPYASIQQFRQALGKYVDAAQVTEWEKYVYVPVSPNTSDAASLMQLPGVDATIAASIVSGRPYASNAAFLEALAKYFDASQVAQIKNYLAAE
ncbi:MAG: hypothetical protein ABIQ44_15150 [Chloroflexia bacterium]